MIRIIVADDERLFSEAITAMLHLEGDIEVVGVAGNGPQALEMARELQPDMMVLDLRMPGLDGIEVIKELSHDPEPVPCLILTSFAHPAIVQAAMASGARGIAPKDVQVSTLASAVRTIAAGGGHVDPNLAAETMSIGTNPLTPRETQMLKLSLGGAPTKDIAQKSGLSTSTVRNHLSAAINKLDVANRHEAAHLARQRGWI
ncbi:MAG: response regulator transcription factor [Promicromonosporaceae bacterium]|nr:response regulator transcription factor [Promicromonosporaceae bacterium]